MIPALIAAIPSVVQLVQGAMQQNKGASMNKPRPNYQISPYLFANRNMYDTLAKSNRVPGQSIIEDKIGQSTAQGVSNLKDNINNPNDLAAGITALNRDNIEFTNNLGVTGSQMRMGSMDKLAGVNNQLTEENNAKNQWETYDPYTQFQAAKSALTGAGMQNVQQGLNGLGSIGTAAAMGSFGQKSKASLPYYPDTSGVPSNYSSATEMA